MSERFPVLLPADVEAARAAVREALRFDRVDIDDSDNDGRNAKAPDGDDYNTLLGHLHAIAEALGFARGGF